MTNWLAEEMESGAKKKVGKLPNPKAPRMVKVDSLPEKKEPKKPVLLKVDKSIHTQLTRYVNLRKLAELQGITVTGMFMEGLELWLKKNKLPSVEEIKNGVEITEDHIK